MEVSILEGPACQHGEGIHLDREQQILTWVDILGKKLLRYELKHSQIHVFDMPQQIGFAIPQTDGSYICGLESGLGRFDYQTQQLIWLGDPEPDLPHNRFNDGKQDLQGRIWANTMDIDAKEVTGSLYCCTFESTAATYQQVDAGFAIGNGPAWSPDYRYLYHAETEKNSVFRFEFDQLTGQISNKTLWYKHHEPGMGPDGMQTDTQGHVWIAMAHGAKLIQVSAAGDLLQQINLPTHFPTSLCFSDADCRQLYVTTSQLDPVAGDAMAGHTLSIQL